MDSEALPGEVGVPDDAEVGARRAHGVRRTRATAA
jgi:hypothetical protein